MPVLLGVGGGDFFGAAEVKEGAGGIGSEVFPMVERKCDDGDCRRRHALGVSRESLDHALDSRVVSDDHDSLMRIRNEI